MILTSEYKSNLGKQITWLIFLIIMTTMFLLAFPIFNDPTVQPIVENNLNNIPKSISNAIFPFGIESFTDISLYFDSILLFIQLMISIYSLNIGLMSLAKEQGFGTIEYLYINPVSRSEIILKKFIGNLFNILILVILSCLIANYAYSYIDKVDFIESVKTNMIKYIIIFLEGFLFLSIGTMISSFAKRTSNLGAILFFVISTVIVINILASLGKIGSPLLNVFFPLRLLQDLNLNDLAKVIIVLIIGKIIIGLFFYIIGHIHYNRKDFIV